MSTQDDRWLWFIDDGPVQALLKAEDGHGTMRLRAAASPGLVRAVTAQMEGRSAEAAAELRAAIDAGDNQPEIFLFLGQIHFEAGQYEEALAVYRKQLDIDSGNAAAAFNAGVCQEKLGRWSEAGGFFLRAVAIDPECRDAWLAIGLCCLHRRQAEDALDGFDRYLERDPNNEPALFGRAVALQMLRRFAEAAEIYDRFRSAGEPSAELLTNLIALAVASKDTVELGRVAVEFAILRPGARCVLEAQAYAALISGRWEDAVAPLAELAETGAVPEDWTYARGYALWRGGRGEEALGVLDTLLEQCPKHAAAQLLRGTVLEETGRPDEALDAYRAASGLAPDFAAASWNVARMAAALGNAGVCREAAEALLDHNRQSAEGWFAKGLTALLDRRSSDAVHAFSEAVRLRPEWPEAEWNLGLSLFENADPGKAERALEKVYEGLRGQVPAEPLARAALANGRPDRALAVLEAAEGLDAAPELVYNVAVAFHETGKLKSAESLYRRVIAAGGSFAGAHINLGHILLATGRPEEAEALWIEAAALESAA